MFIIMELGMLGNAIVKGYFFDKIKAYVGVGRALPVVLKKRKWIQENRRVSDRKLLHFLRAQIKFKEIDSPLLSCANFIFGAYYECIKLFL